MLKSLLFRQKDKAVSQAQYGKGGTRSQPKVLTELLWDGELTLLTDLRSCQIFESCLSARHQSLLVGISYHDLHRPGNLTSGRTGLGEHLAPYAAPGARC